MGDIKTKVLLNVVYYILFSVFLLFCGVDPYRFMEHHFAMVVVIGIALIVAGLFLFRMVMSDFALLLKVGLFCLLPFVGGIAFLWMVMSRKG